MMSEDHEYNESEDEAIPAAKAGGTADEVLMALLICVKVEAICGISRSFALIWLLKYPFHKRN
jgi:hypothetical protein